MNILSIVCTILMLFGFAADTRVADAAMKGDKEAVRSLIKQAADVNSSQGDGMTALHWAAQNGDAGMAQMLLYAGANVKATTRLGGYTPLFIAAKTGQAPVIDVLLKAGADAKTSAADGITPLMMAASSGDAEAVRLLAERGADVNAAETERGQTALTFAAAFNRPEAIKTLLKYGADINRKSKFMKPLPPPPREDQGGFQPPPQQPQQPGQRGQAAPPAAVPVPGGGRGQQAASQNNNNNNEDDSSRAGGNPKGELTPLMYAAREGNFDAVRALVEGGAKLNDVSADRSTALLLATINGHFDIAKFLVERAADVTIPSMDGATALYAVANTQWARKTFHPQPTTKYEKTHYLGLMMLILNRGADPNARLTKDLWYNEYNFNLDATNTAGTTAFWKCAAVGDIDGMRLLVSYGADSNASNIEGVTPLLVASGSGFHGNDEVNTPTGRLAAVKYLVEELHADVNAADIGPAPNSAQQQRFANNNNFGARGAGGFTALHNAAARGDNAMILYLVSKGARVDAVAKNGTTVADMANGPRQRIQPYPDTVAFLELLGSKNSHKCVSC